jgi:hypothetical protein
LTTSVYNPTPPSHWQYGLTQVPTSSTLIQPVTTTLVKGYFSNTTGGDLTITVTDNTTEVAGQPAQAVPGITVAANSIQVIDFAGVTCNGGVKWSASGSGVIGWIHGGY